MLPNKISPLSRSRGFIPRLSRAPKFGPMGGAPDILYRPTYFTPKALANLATWYDVSDLSSMRNNAGAVPSTTDGIKLIADKSGNSAVNVLALNGVAGNYASVPDSAATSPSTGLEFIGRIMVNNPTLGTSQVIAAKFTGTTGHCSYLLRIAATTGVPFISISTDGSTTTTAIVSSGAWPVGALTWIWFKFNWRNSDGAATFSWAADQATVPSSWTQFGTATAGSGSTIFDSDAVTEIGTRNVGTIEPLAATVGYISIAGSPGGTPFLIENFSTASKLATSFTESSSNAATVTINTSGDLGARICGARDLYQGTAANQAVLTVSAKANSVLYDGSNDYHRSALASIPQPVTRFTIANQKTWTSGDYLWDGASAANSGAIIQTTSTPQVNMNAGSSVAANTDWAVDSVVIITEIINGASSSLQIDKLTATTGNAGANNPNGTTIGASGAATAANFGNLAFSEQISYTRVLSAAEIINVQNYLAQKWITV